MNKPLLILVSVALASCGDSAPPATETPPPPPAPIDIANADTTPDSSSAPTVQLPSVGPKVGTKVKDAIDWSSARADLATAGDDTVTIQSSNAPPPAVPVLLPTGIVISQSSEFGPVFRNTPDGYTAFYPGASYNIVVNGTNETVDTDITAADNPDRVPVFSTMLGGAQVWLTRYGADYTVEFECTAAASVEETCISEEDAMDIVEKLIVSRSR